MADYEDWTAQDILAPILEDVKEGRVILKKDKIIIPGNLGCETPWLNTLLANDRHCKVWGDYYHRLYRLVPRKCHYCFKVVVRLTTLRDLMKMREVQKEMNYYSKCGLEIRDFVSALYGAYWYCPIAGGLEGARLRHREVLAAVRKNFSPAPEVILKRGCTEMELEKGPSHTWVYTEADRRLEKLLDDMVEIEESHETLPAYIETRILRTWVQYAYERGDQTYKDFVDHPLVRPVVTYHNSMHEDGDLHWPDGVLPADLEQD